MAKTPQAQIRVDEAKLAAASRAEYHERMQGKPTPSQSELDDIKMGIPVTKSPTGAGQLPTGHTRQQVVLEETASGSSAPRAARTATPRPAPAGAAPTPRSES